MIEFISNDIEHILEFQNQFGEILVTNRSNFYLGFWL